MKYRILAVAVFLLLLLLPPLSPSTLHVIITQEKPPTHTHTHKPKKKERANEMQNTSGCWLASPSPSSGDLSPAYLSSLSLIA